MKRIAILAVFQLVFFSCKKNDSASLATTPLVTTAALTHSTTNTVIAGGTIISDGGAAVTQSGIVWSKTNNLPTKAADSVVAGTTLTGAFTASVSGIELNSIYYFRAFATNSIGTGYGDVVTLFTGDTSKVRFTYNGQEVVYGIIVSPITGKKWLDRNLGAKRVATAFNDYEAYGDMFQWGRQADGHQLMNWTSSTAGTPANGTTTMLAIADIPGHSNFIIPAITGTVTGDWRSDNNSNRWVTASQGPCPAGWHVPTAAEWGAETTSTYWGGTSAGISKRDNAYSKLKLTCGGFRSDYNDVSGTGGQLFYGEGPNNPGQAGFYWCSNDFPNDDRTVARTVEFTASYGQIRIQNKAAGLFVRCIKN